MNQESISKNEGQHPARIPEDTDKGYEDCAKLKELIKGGKYRLDCGHHVTLNHHLGGNIAIINGKELKIILTLCFY
jgi:hypothetical protein